MTKIWVNCCRFLLGAVFIASGFIKANDPIGTFYKIQEYFEAFGLSLPFVYPFIFALVLGVFEFALGIHVFFGINRRRSGLVSVVVLSFMTLLTLWLAIANPIADCGCFGEAVRLTNWETFFKNIVLLGAALSVVRWYKQVLKLVSPKFDWLIALYGLVYGIVLSFYTLRLLPVFDFTPYSIGDSIRNAMEIPEGEKPPVYETVFIYEKDGQQRQLTIDDLPVEDGWAFVNSKTVIKEEGYVAPINDFSIYLQSEWNGLSEGEDVTDLLLANEGYTFLLVAPYLSQADDSNMDLINEIYDYCVAGGYSFLCVTCSTDEDIEQWQENTGAEYSFGIMDETPLKTMVRSNPGLMLIRDGKVYGKWSCNNMPDEYELSAPLEDLPMGKASRKTVRRKIVEVIAWFAVPLLVFTLCDTLWMAYRVRRIKRKKLENKA